MWHYTNQLNEYGMLSHSIDGKVWEDFDTKFPEFASELRNLCLGLATNSINLFGNLESS